MIRISAVKPCIVEGCDQLRAYTYNRCKAHLNEQRRVRHVRRSLPCKMREPAHAPYKLGAEWEQVLPTSISADELLTSTWRVQGQP